MQGELVGEGKSTVPWLAVALAPCAQWDAQPRIGYTGLIEKGQCLCTLPLFSICGDVTC